MKTILALLFLLLPTTASAGLLWGDNVTIHNYGTSDGYTVRYGRSYSYWPSYRTYRVYRGPAQVGYYVPPPVTEYPVVVPEPPVVQDVQPAPVYQTYSVGVDDYGEFVKFKHIERHGRYKSKVKHVEVTR